LPNLLSFATYCVGLELRPLPSAGVTRFPRYYEPLRHPRAPGRSSRTSSWSSLTTPRGFPCCVRFPCVHAIATTPARRLEMLLGSFSPIVSAFPEWVIGSARATTFSRIAQRSLALRPAHSPVHLREPCIEGFSHFVTSMTSPIAFRLELLPGGAFTHWKTPPLHGAHPT
jgi:hypothetical protein